MARPQRNNVDYFPHEVIHGKKMFIIEDKYGNDGYAVWFKLLEQLGKANYHYLDFNDGMQKMYLASLFKVDKEKLFEIIKDLGELGAINNHLFMVHNIIFSEKFVDSIKDAYKRRTNNKCIDLRGLCKHLSIKCTTEMLKSSKIDYSNPQSKVEYSIEDQSKVKEDILNSAIWHDPIFMKRKIDPTDGFNFLIKFLLKQEDMVGEGKGLNREIDEIKNHFVNWLDDGIKKQKDNPNSPKTLEEQLEHLKT